MYSSSVDCDDYAIYAADVAFEYVFGPIPEGYIMHPFHEAPYWHAFYDEYYDFCVNHAIYPDGEMLAPIFLEI